MKISEFGSVRSKQSQTISLQEYVNKVRSNTFKAQVEEYRRLAALPGHEAEAQRVKDGMPCIVPAGVCSGGHAVKNLVKHSGLLQIDMDHTLLRTAEVCRLLCELPYVTVVHKSFSQNGVRAFVRVAAEDVMRNYEQLYAAVGEAVSRHAAHNYDSKCKILTQPSFYSWDADAYYNPDAETFKMQWGEETGKEADAATDSEEAVSASETTTVSASGATAVSASGATTVSASGATAGAAANSGETANSEGTAGASASSARAAAPGFLTQFLNDFEHRNPFRRGERNDLALKLGRVSRSKGFSKKELEEVISLFIRRYAKEYCCTDADFDTAMQIIATVIEHSLLLGTSLPDTGHPPVAMRKFHQFEDVLKKLPRIFSYIDFINAAKELGISVSTAKRYLRKAVEQELVVKQKDKYRKRRKRQGKQGL